jgi:hypothetical protein
MIFFVIHMDFSEVSPRCGSKFIFQTSNEGGGFALTNIVLGKMPAKKATTKTKPGRDLAPDFQAALDIDWGFDSEGNLRTHGALEERNKFSNLGALKEWTRKNCTTDGLGIVYTLTTALSPPLNLGSKNFKTCLWADQCEDGDNLGKESLALFKEFNHNSPSTVVGALDGSTQRGVKGFGEEKGDT